MCNIQSRPPPGLSGARVLAPLECNHLSKAPGKRSHRWQGAQVSLLRIHAHTHITHTHTHTHTHTTCWMYRWDTVAPQYPHLPLVVGAEKFQKTHVVLAPALTTYRDRADSARGCTQLRTKHCIQCVCVCVCVCVRACVRVCVCVLGMLHDTTKVRQVWPTLHLTT